MEQSTGTPFTSDQYRALAERADDAGGYELNETTLIDEMASALRAAADESDQSAKWYEAAREEHAGADHLRTVIETAPHEAECSLLYYGFPVKCNCWKADAL